MLNRLYLIIIGETLATNKDNEGKNDPIKSHKMSLRRPTYVHPLSKHDMWLFEI